MTTALSSCRRGVFKALALWLGLAALMVQTLAPLCAAGATAGAGSAPGVASIVLCTAHGFERIQIGADGQPLPAQDDQKGSDCFLCVAMHGAGAFPTPALIAAAAPSFVTAAPRVVSSVLPPQRKFASAYVTRGPPAFA